MYYYVCCHVATPNFKFCQTIWYIRRERFCFQLWNFIATCSFLGLGVKTIWIWHAGKSDDTINNTTDYANNYPSGLALGALR